MVPIIVSNDGAVHKDAVRRRKSFAPDIKVDWVRMAQNMLRYNVVIVGDSSIMAAWSPRHGDESIPRNLWKKQKALQKELPPSMSEGERLHLNINREGAVCGLRTRHLHVAFS